MSNKTVGHTGIARLCFARSDNRTRSPHFRRIIKEDMYSIIETSFMPSGIECDQYSIIGNILSVNLVENELTKEEIYRLRVECNDIVFTVAINKADLLGEPAPGRRFKGQIWMQGLVDFGVNDMLC